MLGSLNELIHIKTLRITFASLWAFILFVIMKLPLLPNNIPVMPPEKINVHVKIEGHQNKVCNHRGTGVITYSLVKHPGKSRVH